MENPDKTLQADGSAKAEDPRQPGELRDEDLETPNDEMHALLTRSQNIIKRGYTGDLDERRQDQATLRDALLQQEAAVAKAEDLVQRAKAHLESLRNGHGILTDRMITVTEDIARLERAALERARK